MNEWKLLDEFARVSSKWVTLIGERWLCDKGKELEYWRVEKVDSVIVLPIQNGKIFCVKPSYRVGVQRSTLDFPGGRLPDGKQPSEIVPFLMERELGVPASAIRTINELNDAKWIINSSFSNQGLWGFAVEIDNDFTIPDSYIGEVASLDDDEISRLLTKLDCSQCRLVLLEWLRKNKL